MPKTEEMEKVNRCDKCKEKIALIQKNTPGNQIELLCFTCFEENVPEISIESIDLVKRLLNGREGE